MSTGISNQFVLEDVRSIVNIEEERFTLLVQSHSRLLFRIAYAMTRNVHDAEDVVQDTFLKIYKNAAWRKMTDAKAFLARSAWRVALDKIERQRRESALQTSAQAAAGPEDAAIQMDSDAQVHRLIDALPEELRQPLALSAIEELNSREIGELLGIPEGTVRTRLMRSRQILKDKISALRGQSL